MTTRRAILAGLTAGASLSGCVTVLPKAEPVQLYRFGVEPGRGPDGSEAGGAGSTPVRLIAVNLPAAARGDGILTVTGHAVAYVRSARWVSPASVLFFEALEAGLSQGRPALQIVRRGDGDAAVEMRLDVHVFETDRSSDPPRVIVRADLVLQDPRRNSLQILPVAAEVRAREDRVSAIVEAYDQAVAEIVRQARAAVTGVRPSG